MEKHKCKLCLKSFANGRALGGHMRSHMLSLCVTPKPPPPHSPPSSSSEEDEDDGDDDCHELTENSKKSLPLDDPELAFRESLTVTNTTTEGGGGGGGIGGGSMDLQDRESETETSKRFTVRRRSKRIRRQVTSWFGDQQHYSELDRNRIQNQWQHLKKSKIFKPSTKIAESSTTEPVSSISDTSREEDVAYCLMMLSRDKWTDEDRGHEETDNESESDREIINMKRAPARTKYRCETCNRVFRSYQALGGHRASHKKNKQSHHDGNHQIQNASMDDKVHECAVCFKVFASGQALGGHKRSHVAGSSASMATNKTVAKQSISLFDLNLPAPIDEEEDEISQIEVSVVSDGEFVKTH